MPFHFQNTKKKNTNHKLNCGRTFFAFFFTLQNVLRKRPIFEASLRFRWLTVWMFETFTATHNFRETNLCKLSSAKIGRVWDSKLVKNQFHIKSKGQKKYLISTLWNGVPPSLSSVYNLYRNVLHPNWKGKGVSSWLDKKLHLSSTSYVPLFEIQNFISQLLEIPSDNAAAAWFLCGIYE